MNCYIDTEFIETETNIELVSIALVFSDKLYYYGVSSEFNPANASAWVVENVLKKLPDASTWKSLEQIKKDILFLFVGKEPISFYGSFCAYDWYLFMHMFGGVAGCPWRWCYDLAPWTAPSDAHTALEDAMHLYRQHQQIIAAAKNRNSP